MTARELIAQWFDRPQAGVASNERFITTAQIALLRRLLDQEEVGEELHKGMNGSFIWMPPGLDKFVVTEGAGGKRNTIVKLSNIAPSEAGRLF